MQSAMCPENMNLQPFPSLAVDLFLQSTDDQERLRKGQDQCAVLLRLVWISKGRLVMLQHAQPSLTLTLFLCVCVHADTHI